MAAPGGGEADSALRLFFKTFGYRAVAIGSATANLFGGLEEFLCVVCCCLGLTTLRASCDTRASRLRRGCCRIPTVLFFFLAYTLIRIRPRSTVWPISSDSYYAMPLDGSRLTGTGARAGKGGASTSFGSLPSAPSPPARGDIRTTGRWFRDEDNRVAILRGVNLAGGVSSRPGPSQVRRTRIQIPC